MVSLDMTDHVRHRIRQRGLRESDLAFVFEHGSEVADGVFLRDQDVRNVIGYAKTLINLATRLRRTYVVIKDDKLITVYRPTKRKEKRILQTINDPDGNYHVAR